MLHFSVNITFQESKILIYLRQSYIADLSQLVLAVCIRMHWNIQKRFQPIDQLLFLRHEITSKSTEKHLCTIQKQIKIEVEHRQG